MASEREIARRTANAVEVVSQPVRLRFRLEDLPCADAHLLRVVYTCSASVLEKPIERRAFVETFLTAQAAVTVDDLVEHFSPALRRAAEKLTATQPAHAWLDGASRDLLLNALRGAATPIEFDSGLKLMAPFDLVVESDSFQQERLESARRQAAERRAAEQVQHVQRATEMLKQFTALRQAAPELSAGAILQQLNAADRPDMYQALLLAGEQSPGSALWAVSGDELLAIDPLTTPPRIERIPLPGGPFRSVHVDEIDEKRVLLLGGRDRVTVVNPETKAGEARVASDAASAHLGFNKVAHHSGRLWATHGELGVRAWNPDGSLHAALPIDALPRATFFRSHARISGSIQTITASTATSAPAGPRNITSVDRSRLLLSIGNRIAIVDSESLTISPAPGEDVQAEVLAIFTDRARVLVIYDNGTIHILDPRTLHRVRELPRAGAVRAAAPLPWMGDTRILLAGDDGCIDCIGLDDAVITEYRSSYRDVRELAASETTVAAITADRSRLVLWHSWDGSQPFAEINLSALTRRRVGDICFG
ncbi:MAG TPA: hypothetical protein VF669_08115 [Tepidisphaeraceae bacterium]|jgi:hypothetical protein